MSDIRAKVAANLRAIEDMAGRLEQRAIDRATDRELPGGDAMVALATVGSIRDWLRRVDITERLHSDDPWRYPDATVDMEHEDPDQFWPAVQVLWWWSEDYRIRLEMDYDDPRWRPTLTSEAAFLRNTDVADWVWNHEVHFEDYAADVARAKSKLENILIEGERSERTPVVCDRCEDKRPMVRVYADGGAEDDRWKCLGCKHLFTTEELADARATQMRRTEPREWISRTQAIDLLRSMGHQGRTAARLADLPEAQGWRHEVTRVRFVSWPDVWRSHLLALQQAKIRLEDALRTKEHKATCESDHAEDCWIPGRGCSKVCPRGEDCEWFLCPVHAERRATA